MLLPSLALYESIIRVSIASNILIYWTPQSLLSDEQEPLPLILSSFASSLYCSQIFYAFQYDK